MDPPGKLPVREQGPNIQTFRISDISKNVDIEDILTKTILFVSKHFYSSLHILLNYQKLKICANEEHMNHTGSVEARDNNEPMDGSKKNEKSKERLDKRTVH